ncbi:MAG TPA: tetratricopeptide repeat protein [Kofleriaceae bacterium]
MALDPDMTAKERETLAARIFASAKTLDSDAKLEHYDRAMEIWPQLANLRLTRGRLYADLGRHREAIEDFDAALAHTPDAKITRWERAKSKAASGDRAGALADARAVQNEISDARAWVASQESDGPRRVRHAKFGVGTVVAVSGANLTVEFADGKKTIASRFVEPVD